MKSTGSEYKYYTEIRRCTLFIVGLTYIRSLDACFTDSIHSLIIIFIVIVTVAVTQSLSLIMSLSL